MILRQSIAIVVDAVAYYDHCPTETMAMNNDQYPLDARLCPLNAASFFVSPKQRGEIILRQPLSAGASDVFPQLQSK
jgi:hypothetical protein